MPTTTSLALGKIVLKEQHQVILIDLLVRFYQYCLIKLIKYHLSRNSPIMCMRILLMKMTILYLSP